MGPGAAYLDRFSLSEAKELKTCSRWRVTGVKQLRVRSPLSFFVKNRIDRSSNKCRNQTFVVLGRGTTMTDEAGKGKAKVMRLFSGQLLNDSDEALARYYEPKHLLDVVAAKIRVESDVQVLHKLVVVHLVIKWILKEDLSTGPEILLALIHDSTGISVQELRDLLGTEDEGA
jgi:hypothetical protein